MKTIKRRLFWSLLFLTVVILTPSFAASSWNLQINTADPTLYGVYAVSDTVLTAAGSEGAVMKSTDRGATWSSSVVPAATYTWYGVAFPTSLVGYITGTKSGTNCYIYKTTNGGTSWSQNYTDGVSEVFFDTYFADADTGWAVGRNVVSPPVRVYRTTNGGTDWNRTSLNWSSRAYGVHAVLDGGAYSVWVVGEGGHISKSTDGGVLFSDQTSGTANTLYDVFFYNNNTGWAVGDGGTILSTTNGGTNWTAQTSGVTALLTGVQFVSATTGFAVGAGGTILSTTNGGSTWTAETSGTTANLYRVYFYDAYNGWAVGGSSRAALIREEASINSLSRSSATQGTNSVTVTIQGAGFKAGMTPSFSGSGITVTSTTITSATEMSITFDIAAGAATGSRDIRYLTAAGNLLTFSNRFTVLSSSVTNPTISSLSQNILSVGNTYNIVGTGTGYQSGATVTINGVTVNSVTVNSSTQLTANVTVPAGHATGLFNWTVTNTDGGAGTFANGIIIASTSGGPTVTGVITEYGYKGTVSNVVVNGTGFANNSQVFFSGSGVAGTVTYISSTQLRVAVTISADDSTAVGSRTVTVFNPTDSTVGALEGGFEIKAASTTGKVIKNVVIGPNPARRGTTVINIQGEATTAPLTLDIPIFDATGRMLARLSRNITQPGRFSIPWNILTDNLIPGDVSNGLHIISINTLGVVQQRAKVVIAR
ncbi:hypothetical protein HZC35_05380 [Candidatus Saganbacteria bacterium]|nr:hypothetical protein [Candidatus Saganbacteria bacterium]